MKCACGQECGEVGGVSAGTVGTRYPTLCCSWSASAVDATLMLTLFLGSA